MKLSAPKQITFWVAIVVGVIGLIASLVTIHYLSDFALWIVVLGFVILAAGNLLEGL
jgi:general stress protein CsbA